MSVHLIGSGSAMRAASDSAAAPIFNSLRHQGVVATRALSPLPDDAQREVDQAVVKVGMDRLNLVRRLMELGLTKPQPNWWSVPSTYWERKGRHGQARRGMYPRASGRAHLGDRNGRTYPIFATYDDTNVHTRLQAVSERAGQPIETDNIEESTRNVHEAVEDQGFNGGIVVQGNSSPGFLTAPNVKSQTLLDNEAWAASGHSGEDIETDLMNCVDQLEADGFYGPYELIVGTLDNNKLNRQYNTNYPEKIRQHLMEMEFGGRPLGITVADQCPSTTIILFQADTSTARVIVGQEPAVITYGPDPFNVIAIVIACLIVQVRDNYDGKCGIVVGTP